jgi:hypothetical protein
MVPERGIPLSLGIVLSGFVALCAEDLFSFHPEMALFTNFGINHAKDVTGLAELLVRRTRVRLRVIP